jgi:hypothetical protein
MSELQEFRDLVEMHMGAKWLKVFDKHTNTTHPADGELVEELCIVKRVLQAQIDSCASPMDSCAECDRFARSIDAVSKAITALQGVTISRECAENSLNVVRSVLEDSEERIRKLGPFKQYSARTKYRPVLKVIEATENELAKALEHSNESR